MNVIIIAAVFLLQLYVFFSFGALFLSLFRQKLQSVTLTYLFGFLYYFIFFGLFALPAIFTHQPLSTLTHTWMGFTGIVTILSTVFTFKYMLEQAKSLPEKLKSHGWMFFVLAFAVILQMMFVFTHIDGSADASYYIGKVTTDVYTNTLGHFDPYTGAQLTQLDGRRAIACFPEYNAVISQFFHLHPLKQAKLIMPEIIILTVNIIYYQIGLFLFDNNKKKASGMVFFTALIDLYSYTIYTSSTFLLTRTYEGKSILANIIIPGMIFAFLILWKKGHTPLCKLLFLGLSISSCIFSSSSMLIIPVGLTAGFVPWIVKERKFSQLGWYLLYIVPNMLVCVLYLLISKGYLVYTIK